MRDPSWSLSGIDASARWRITDASSWRAPVASRRSPLTVPGRHGSISTGLTPFDEPQLNLVVQLVGDQVSLEEAQMELLGLLSAPGLTATRTSGGYTASAAAELVSVSQGVFVTGRIAEFVVTLALPGVFLRGDEVDSFLAPGGGTVPGLTGSTAPVGDALLRVQGPNNFSLVDEVSGTGISWQGVLDDSWFLYVDTATLRAWVAQDDQAWDATPGGADLATNGSFEKAATGTVATPVVRENLIENPRIKGTMGDVGIVGGGATNWSKSDFTASGQEFDRLIFDYSILNVTGEQTGTVIFGMASSRYVLVTVGKTYTASTCAQRSTAGNATFYTRLSWRDSAGDQISFVDSSPNSNPWEQRYVTDVAPAGATHAAVFLVISHTSQPLQAGDTVRVSQFMLEPTDQERPYFDGSAGAGNGPFYAYLDSYWVGATDGSASALVPTGAEYPQAVRPLDFSPVNDADPVQAPGAGGVTSTFGVVSGSSSIAVVPDGSTSDTAARPGQYREIPCVPGRTYTVAGTITLAEPQANPEGSRQRTIAIVTSDNIGASQQVAAQSVSAPNEAGSHRVSVTFTLGADRSLHHVRLYNGSALPSDVVWWDDVTITEGDAINAGPGLDYPAAGRLQLWPRMNGTDPSVRDAQVTVSGATEVTVRARPAYL